MIPYLVTLLLVGPPVSSGGGAPGGRDRAPRAEERTLCQGKILRVARSPYGGLSLKVMLRFDSGRAAVFKPAQTGYAARYEAEIAAYRLATLLGVPLVPPACERRLPRSALLGLASDPGQAALRARMERELTPEADGTVRGVAIHFVPRVTELPAARRKAWSAWLAPGASVPNQERARLADVADLLLLDLLFSNPDRFTGGNLLVDQSTGRLLMVDNGADFRPVAHLRRPYHQEMLALLGRVRSSTYRRMRGLTRPIVIAQVRRPAGEGSYLTYPEVRALFARRDALVKHVEELRRKHGDAAVLLP